MLGFTLIDKTTFICKWIITVPLFLPARFTTALFYIIRDVTLLKPTINYAALKYWATLFVAHRFTLKLNALLIAAFNRCDSAA